MLYAIDGKQVMTVWHQREHRAWISKLAPEELKAMKDKLNSMVDQDRIHTSSWMPGSDWTGTVFQPIWEKACGKNVQVSALCFGLILCDVMMARPEKWTFIQYDRSDNAISGTTYIRHPD